MAAAARRVKHTCTECGTLSTFAPGQDIVCKTCGRPADVPLGAEGPGGAPPRPTGAKIPPREPPTALAAVALVAGLLAAMTFWVFPISMLFALASIGCGVAALTRHEDDTGAQVMAGIGVGLGALALIFIFFLLPFWFADSGSSAEFSSSGGTYDSGSGGSSSSRGGGGGSSGDGGGSSDGGSPESGGSSGGTTDPATGAEKDSPAPVALLSGLGLLAAAAWRRRQ